MHFFANNPRVTSDQFEEYTSFLTKNRSVKAWAWVEPTGRLAGAAAASSNSQNPVLPSAYPVTQVAPWPENKPILGYDFYSDPACRQALISAAQTGLTTVTTPVSLPFVEGDPTGILVCQPVFTGDALHSRLQGFAIALLHLENVLRNSPTDDAVLMELSILQTNGAPAIFADSEADAPFLFGHEASVIRPIFAFSRVLLSRPGPDPLLTGCTPRGTAGWPV